MKKGKQRRQTSISRIRVEGPPGSGETFITGVGDDGTVYVQGNLHPKGGEFAAKLSAHQKAPHYADPEAGWMVSERWLMAQLRESPNLTELVRRLAAAAVGLAMEQKDVMH